MLAYFVRRSLAAVGTLWVVSLIAFVIIQLPPGDYVTAYIAAQQTSGTVVTEDEADTLRELYGLNDQVYIQYTKWLLRVVQGDFGLSMEYRLPVTDVIGDRLWTTIALAAMAVLFVWIVCPPNRGVLCGQTILPSRLHNDIHRLLGSGYPELPACSSVDVLGIQVPER